jgi:hypothetical protein
MLFASFIKSRLYSYFIFVIAIFFFHFLKSSFLIFKADTDEGLHYLELNALFEFSFLTELFLLKTWDLFCLASLNVTSILIDVDCLSNVGGGT